MTMSEGLTELKYQEIIEYQELVTNAAIDSMMTNTLHAQISCLFTAILTSLLMGCCAMIFMPGPKHNNQR